MEEHKLLITPAIKSLSWIRKFGYKKPLENSPLKFGVKIKNIDKKPFGGARIKNIKISQSGIPKETAVEITCDLKFDVKKLNPEEEILIWFERTVIPFSGLAWIYFELESSDKIITYQWDKGNKSPSKLGENRWYDAFLVIDENIFQQKITNFLLIILTLLIFILSFK